MQIEQIAVLVVCALAVVIVVPLYFWLTGGE